MFRTRYYQFSLSMIPLIRIFFIFGLLVYSQSNNKYVARRKILLQTLHQAQLQATQGFYITSMDFYGFLWISSALSRSPKKNIIDHFTNSAHPIFFRWVSVLKFWQYSFISSYQISISMSPSENLYGKKCRRHLVPKFCSVYWENYP